jgi:monovalent cation/hydrogen antiporter
MNGWHETYNDEPGLGVVCGHLHMIAVPPAPPDPPDACGDCLIEGTTWVELRRCLVCGRTSCCQSSPRRHADAHFARTGHPVVAMLAGGPSDEVWGWCYADNLALSRDS